jgi:hypothetical protein
MSFAAPGMDITYLYLINTWLQPGASSKHKREPFPRLSCKPKNVKTVFPFSSTGTELKTGVNEKGACLFDTL